MGAHFSSILEAKVGGKERHESGTVNGHVTYSQMKELKELLFYGALQRYIVEVSLGCPIVDALVGKLSIQITLALMVLSEMFLIRSFGPRSIG